MYVNCWLTCCAVVALLVLYCPSSLAVTSSTCKNNDVWGPTIFAGQCYDQQTEEFCIAACSQKKLNIPANANTSYGPKTRLIAVVLITLCITPVAGIVYDSLLRHLSTTALIVFFTSCCILIAVFFVIDQTAISEKYAAGRANVNAETSYGTKVGLVTFTCIFLCAAPVTIIVTEILKRRLAVSTVALIVLFTSCCVFITVLVVFDLAAVDEEYVRICCLVTAVAINLYGLLLPKRQFQPPVWPVVQQAATSQRLAIVAGG